MSFIAKKIGLGLGGSALAVAMVSMSSAAYAQSSVASTDDAPTEEIVVTGFRAMLRSAISEKRQSVTQVDAITAEDIADFPDSNLAESLQRMPGISIDRDNGDGRGITVRGLSGDFNRTRLNGLEALATAGSNDSGTSPNRSRSFDYNTFASELFSSLKVQKTPDAKTDEGSLGATIDLQTGRPFDYKRRAFAFSAEGSYQDNAKKWSPRLAGLISTRFLDDSMGILVSGAWSKSNNSIDGYRRQVGQSDYLYRATDFLGNENPQRAGFAAPTGTTFGTAITNPGVAALLTGSDPAAYAKLFPGAPYNTPGRFDDSLVRIPSLANIEQQDVKTERLGLTASYQWQVSDQTRLSIDGVYSRFSSESSYKQLQTVGLNRNNTNVTLNTAGNTTAITTARGLYPGLCVPNAGSAILPAQDCGQATYGTTPVFGTALNASNASVASILGLAAVVPGGVTPATANTFSVNPNNLDPYDYYNNPGSVGYIPSANHLAFRGQLIGRPSVRVLQSNVTNGLADYLVLQGVDWRSAVDYSSYTTKFKQLSGTIDHEFSDQLKFQLVGGFSESQNDTIGKLVEFNRMDTPESFTYDERNASGSMPIYNLGFDATDPTKWDVVKGFSAMRMFRRIVTNKYRAVRGDLEWSPVEELKLSTGISWRRFGFQTSLFDRNNDLLNPTLREAGVTTASMSQVVNFGQGLNVPTGTTTSFIAPDLNRFSQVIGFDCNCINKFGDFRITDKRGGGANNFSVNEDDLGAYLQADVNFDIAGRPFRGNFGARYVRTAVDATGNSTAGRALTGSNQYEDFLPSINLSYEPVDDLIARVAMSQVMARPQLGNLSPTITNITIPTTGALDGATMTIGNPKLQPFRSTNFDASLEWYFAPGGLVSFAFFNKKIDSFPQTIAYEASLSDFLDATAVAALRQQFTDPNQLAYIDANGPFQARQFRDAPGGYIRGIEASFQMDFTFLPGLLKNFGIQANYTKISSELNYILDPGSRTTSQVLAKAPFLGVSPQAFNATLYYESKKVRARVSAAQRKGFSLTYPIASGGCAPGIVSPVPASPGTIGTANAPGGPCNAPLVNDFTFSKSTLNVDASASWNITDFATVSIEALNLTNQRTERYAYQAQSAVTNYASTGRIYRAGVRIKFK